MDEELRRLERRASLGNPEALIEFDRARARAKQKIYFLMEVPWEYDDCWTVPAVNAAGEALGIPMQKAYRSRERALQECEQRNIEMLLNADQYRGGFNGEPFNLKEMPEELFANVDLYRLSGLTPETAKQLLPYLKTPFYAVGEAEIEA